MSEDSLSEDGWHIVGTLGDGSIGPKEPEELLSGDNPTKGLILS